jgi:peroxiredoxin
VDEKKGGGRLATVAMAAIVLVVAAAVVVGVLYWKAPRLTRVRVGQTAPDSTLPLLEPSALMGSTATVSRMGGPLILFFLDTRWPDAGGYASSAELVYRRNFRRGLRMAGVFLDDDVKRAADFARAHELTFMLLTDPHAAKVAAKYGTPRAPEAYLLDAKGQVEAVFTDRIDWADPQTREAIEKHLDPGAW